MIITGGKYRSRKLISPQEKIVKPTLSKVRESVFNVLASRMDFVGKSFLDLFAGSGVMGFEAVSRGFEALTAIDNCAPNVRLLMENAKKLDIKADFWVKNSLTFLKNLEDTKFDVIYIDPPYDTDLAQKSLDLITENKILAENGFIVIETRKDRELNLKHFKTIQEKQYGICKLLFLSN